MTFKVYKTCCNNCLFSEDAIVSPKKRVSLLKEISQKQSHFVCHKASMQGEDVCCRKFYDNFGHQSQMIRIAERLGMLKFVDQPNSEKMVSHKEIEEQSNKG